VTQRKHDVVMVGGKPRIFATWESCAARFNNACFEPAVLLTHSDDLGATWSTPEMVSVGGDNYFVSISQNGAGRLAVAYYTSRYDPVFHNRQDVELRSISAATGHPDRRARRLTPRSNEPEADPVLGGVFIGDYIEVFANRGRVWTHYTANARQVSLLGLTPPVAQQDNYLSVSGF